MKNSGFTSKRSKHAVSFTVFCLQLVALIVVDVSPAGCQASPDGPRTTSKPATAASLPSQLLGPDDLIAVSVYDAPELSRPVRVAADGTILLPLMQHAIHAAGLMTRELETQVETALRDEKLLKEPNVVISVLEYGTRPIVVTGAVRNSVTFQPVGQVTLMDALSRAGGVAPDAGPEVLVSDSQGPNPGLVRRIPIKPLLDASDPKLNLSLKAGDEVRVPVASRISVLGNVKNTGMFLIPDATDSTVLGALVLAGGFAGPKPNVAYIIRRDDSQAGTHQIRVPLKDIMDRKVPDVRLVAHDYLYIPNNRKSETFQMLEKIAGVAGSSAFVINVVK